MNVRFFLLIFLSLLMTNTNCAQTAVLFTGDKDLGSSQVNNLLQDTQGYVWVATSRGLTRYDGHRFETFLHTEAEESLMGNYVECLAEDGKGGLLVGTTVGLCRFSPATGRFAKVRLMEGKREQKTCHVQTILKKHDGTVLIATSETGLYEIGGDALQAHHVTGPLKSKTNDVKAMVESNNGTLWMAGGIQGVVRITKDNKLRAYALDDYPVVDVCIDRRGMVYACGHTGGIYRYDPIHDAFVSIWETKFLSVNRLAASSDGRLLIATNGHGLMSLDTTCRLSPYTILQNEIESKSEKMTAIMEDSDGNLWLGIDQKGLLMHPHNTSFFEYIGPFSATHNLIGNRSVSAIYQGNDSTLWVGTGGNGLYALSSDGGSRHYNDVPTDVLSICEDKDGNIFLASWLNGCGRLNRKTGSYEQLDCTREGNAIHVMSILTDKDNRLWIATCGDGLKCLDLKTTKLEEYHAKDGSNETDNVLSNNFVGGLSISADGQRLYFSMSAGLGCLDLRSSNFVSVFGKNRLLSHTAVHTVREDNNGNIWAVTPEGMYLINPKTGVQQRLTTADGLPTNEIASLEVADDGTLWVSTLHGLCHFEPSTRHCINYFKSDGLQGNEFGNTASAHLTDGRMAFGGTGGLTLFHPKAFIRPTLTKRQVRLTGLTVGGEPVTTQTRSGWYQVCDTTVSLSTTFHLAHNYNSLTLSFSTMDFAHADGLHYEYAVGRDSAWQRLPTGVSELTMSHLAHGTYPVRVRAVSSSNVSDELNFIIEVHPAWYASVYAKITYAILAILFLWLYLRWRQRAEWQRLRVQEHIHAAQMREMEETATVKETNTPNVAKEEQTISEETEQQEKIEQTVENLIEKPSIQTPNDRLLERVVKVINAHITESDFGVEQIASEVGISRAHLHRKMKELTGESTSDFVRNVRMKRAAYLLESSHQPIAEVMYACGYDSPANFSRVFKQFYGMPPTEYMRTLNKG